MWKVMERGGNGKLYYADQDGVNELIEQGSLELGDRVYIEDQMLYAGNDGKLYSESGSELGASVPSDIAANPSAEVAF